MRNFSCILFLVAFASYSQNVVLLDLDKRTFAGNGLSYLKQNVIKGIPTYSGENVDGIQLTVIQQKDTSVFESSYWTRTTDAKEFSLTINNLLKTNASYILKLELFKGGNEVTIDPTSIFNDFNTSIQAKIPTTTISRIDLEKLLRNVLDSIADKHLGQYCDHSKDKKSIVCPPALSNYVNFDNVIQKYLDNRSIINTLQVSEKEKSNFLNDLKNGTGIDQDLKNILISEIDDGKDPDKNKLLVEAKAKVDTSLINNYDSIKRNYNLANKEYDNFVKEISNNLPSQFKFLNKKKVFEIDLSADLELEGTRLGTVYGIAAVSLDQINEFELFQFIGVNIRWGDHDSRLKGKEKYVHPILSRFSTLIGVVTSPNMEYKGKQLSDTHLGFKPVFGINAEPCQHLNIGVGAVAFIPKLGTSSTDIDQTRFRLFMSLSFDFDLFNMLIRKNSEKNK